jgi:hypothetical protein
MKGLAADCRCGRAGSGHLAVQADGERELTGEWTLDEAGTDKRTWTPRPFGHACPVPAETGACTEVLL